MTGNAERRGMTLIEVVITASVIGLLAVFLVPAIVKAVERRENATVASHMRVAVNAFDLYRSEMGEYPPDTTPAVLPPEITAYFNDLGITGWWTESTEIGGRWDWDNGYHYAYSVSIASPTVSEGQLVKLDAMLDDGDLATGTFRRSGSQYHYILEE